MRSEYGKLMYLLQDAASPDLRNLLEFDCRKPIKTVYNFLKERGAEALLKDPDIHYATNVICIKHLS